MNDEQQRGVPIKVTVKDKRRTSRAEVASEVSKETPGVSAGADGDQVLMDETSSVEQIPLGDAPGYETPAGHDVPLEMDKNGSEPVVGRADVVEHDYLDDLRRLQAEFDNYRKRTAREQAATAARATGRFVESLLPALDNFERAIEHGEGGEGVALVFKELKGILSSHGVEEIPSEGKPFDPNVHEAVATVEDASVSEMTVREVYRRGYRIEEQVIRPATVVVARPPQEDGSDAPEEGA